MKKILITTLLMFAFLQPSFGAGSSSDGGNSKTDYEKAVKFVEQGKKYDEKGKTDKAQKRYKKAQKLLLKSNKEIPGKADTLNYLGFTTRKLGDFENGEKYYLLGLEINPSHVGINEYLGELYLETNRKNLALERLAILENCNCEEYEELKILIEKN